MHDTFIKDVKLHVDSIEKKDKEISISGWCGSSSVNVDDVRLTFGDKSCLSSIFGKKRKDVSEFYKDEKFLNSGFDIKTSEEIEDSSNGKLEILENGKWKIVAEIEIEKEPDFKISQNITPNFLVIDDFYENPDEIRDFALSCTFKDNVKYHKGRRTEKKFIPE